MVAFNVILIPIEIQIWINLSLHNVSHTGHPLVDNLRIPTYQGVALNMILIKLIKLSLHNIPHTGHALVGIQPKSTCRPRLARVSLFLIQILDP